MSGFFGQIAGGLMGNAGMMQALPGLLTQLVGTAQGAAGGGLPALLQQMETAGLGEQARAWVGGQPHVPVAPEQLGQVFPPGQVDEWARQAGTTPEALLQVLAQALPHAVDHATPNGEVPPPSAPSPDFGGLVGRLFGR
jgi:uncharacterized protein YidB (DUF937 family)